jgi:polyhydroxyalkanoate synthesis regulator protein
MIRFYGHAMQGMMGAYMEKTMQTFVEVQARMQDQSKSLYDGRGVPNPELWTQFMQGQAPMMQNMMSNYIEQSKNLFFQMQDQMQQQARNVFQNFPANFPATGFPPPPPAQSDNKDKP